MPTRDGYPEGTPSWVDLGTTDLARARDFYADLFGWEYREEDTDSTTYLMATRKGLTAAGMGENQDPSAPSVWSTYFAVDDADATAAKIEAAGGSLMMESFDVMDAGRMAFAIDPTGAIFGIWQARNHFGAAIVNEHGALNWNELLTDDLDSALAFYVEVFGWSHQTANMPTGPYTAVSVGDRVVAGAMPKPDPEIPNHWSAYFAVDDTAKAVETATSRGGQVSYGPMEVEEVGVFAGLVDPAGAHFTVIQLATEVD